MATGENKRKLLFSLYQAESFIKLKKNSGLWVQVGSHCAPYLYSNYPEVYCKGHVPSSALSFRSLGTLKLRALFDNPRMGKDGIQLNSYSLFTSTFSKSQGKFMKLARASEMQAIDKCAIDDFGIPGIVLMENAGKKTADLSICYFGNPLGKKVVVFAGPGNNGGDGFVVARHLHEAGAYVKVFLLVDPDKIKGDALINFRIVKRMKIPFQLISSPGDIQKINTSSCFLMVDALFGTGLKRQVADHFAACVDLMNSSQCPVVAVDIASGIDSDSGFILGCAVQADLTVTYGLAKPGQFIFPGRELTGKLEVVDIGFPSIVVEKAHLTTYLLTKESTRVFLPFRHENSHKGSHGHLLIVAGEIGKTGAAILCGSGALRTGAGLVSLCVARQLNAIVESALYEAMTIPLAGGESGAPVFADFDAICRAMAGKQAMVLGPGIGTADETAELVKRLCQEADVSLVIDADGLNVLAQDLSRIGSNSFPRILTPHPGEMARLIGSTSKEVQENRYELARDFAMEHGVYLVLKGAGTLVASPDGMVAINNSGNSGMAAGGMGDVLSGIIGSLLVQKVSPWQACCLAVFLHGFAADRLAEKGLQGYLASEVANFLPAAMQEMIK